MSFTSSLFGSKPKVPALQKLDLGTEQGLAIGQNASNLPAIENLAALVNLFNQSQMDSSLEAALPGFGQSKGAISKNILDLAQGKIPSDISDAVQNSGAARALGGGYAGSGMHRDLVARDLGLTSLNVMQKGLDSMSSWLAKTKAPTFDVTSMFISPAQRAAFDTNERDMQFQHDWLKNQIKAMPDPGTAGWWNFGWGLVDSVLGASSGGNFDGMGQTKTGAQSPIGS